jgi:hypothetical protein
MSNKVTDLTSVPATLAPRPKVSKDGRGSTKTSLRLIPLTVFHTLVVALED